ncbi:MAG: hypothetical protein ACFFFG_01535 [Candidatus Thorarchaeota archaeon]
MVQCEFVVILDIDLPADQEFKNKEEILSYLTDEGYRQLKKLPTFSELSGEIHVFNEDKLDRYFSIDEEEETL